MRFSGVAMASRWWRAVDAAGVRVAAARAGSRTGGALRLVTRASDGAGLWLAAAALATAGGTRGRRAAARGGGRPGRHVGAGSPAVSQENLVSAVP